MRIFTQLDPSTYEEIEELVKKGEYESVDQFLRVAAQNQLAIERSETDQKQETEPERLTRTWGYKLPQGIPTGGSVSGREDLLLFSQYYRFFPLKCALYALAQFTANEGDWVSVEKARSRVVDSIQPIRDAIVDWEEANDIKKKNKKSTALPKRDSKNPERSRRRYQNHYLAKIQPEKDRVSGFGIDMGYLAFRSNENQFEIALTESGVRFLELTNPLIDKGPEAPTLSDREQRYIVTTIRQDLDEEYRFIQYVYEILSRSSGSYTDHIDQFREFLSESSGAPNEMTDNNVRSHVGGVISRMVELDILARGRRRGWYEAVNPPDSYEPVPELQA